MNILLSSYSCNPFHGSEDGIGWHWVLELSKNFSKPDDKIYLVTKKFNEEDTRKGIEQEKLSNVKLVIVDVPEKLNWFKEKHSAFHHIYYIMWQRVAYNWAKKSGIKFDIIHHITMGDFRIPGNMYKFKDAYTIFGPVGGGQSTPKALKGYEKYPVVEKFREFVNKSRAISPAYKSKIKKFDDVYAINKETAEILSKALKRPCKKMFELAVADEFRNLQIAPKEKADKVRIVFVGRLIEKKGLMLLLDAIKNLSPKTPFELKIYGSGPLEERLSSRIKEYSLESKVELCGAIDHSLVSQAYKDADIFVMPSLRETSGNVIIEALAHKVAIVALDMSICSDLKEYNCGEFINTNQEKEDIIKEFSSKLAFLIDNYDTRIELGNNGYNFVNTNLTWDEKFKKVYGNIL
ncbi:MAG: glycosyltransferase family 4 protein [Eubacterium sp.]